MIALVRGTVAVRRPDHVVLDCHGVGYRLSVSSHTLQHIPGLGEKVTLHAHLVSRDEAPVLYGFHSEEERELFLMLLAVQAVGPKVALAVLSGGTPRELLGAIATADAARFQAVNGVGKRTAERIIVELRDKVADSVADIVTGPITASRGDDPRRLAREGLVGLGYGPAEVDDLLRDAPDGGTTEELIAHALKAGRP